MKELDIIKKICKKHGVSYIEVLKRGRRKKIVDARFEIARELKKLGYSTPEIGVILRRDHSTVLNMLK